MTQSQLLSEYARIINVYGLDSEEEKVFIEQYKNSQELIELCNLSRKLKKLLMK